MTRLFAALLLGCAALAHAAEFDPNWPATGVFSNAASCTGCHRASTDSDPAVSPVMRHPLSDTGTDVSPSKQWRHSVMAHAFDDPYYRAKVEDEAALFPGLAGFIEDKCLTCHAPMARTHAHQANVNLTVDASCPLPNGCYRLDTADTQDHAREGVSCTLCHQIKADNLGTSASFSGGYAIAAAGDPDAQIIYGPHQNPVAGPMNNNTIYTPAFGVQTTASDDCATCHTLYTPTLDADTDLPTGDDFLEQGAYLEWRNSVYATGNPEEKQCQDCHMPEPEAGVYASRTAVQPNGTVNEGWPERSPFFTHSMVGANTWLLTLLRDNRAALEISNTTTVAGFNDRIADTRKLLQTGTASLTITQAALNGDELDIDVEIANHTGHKLPTGFPSRRMWVHLAVRDANGQIVFESGAVDANGQISTDDDRLDADCLAASKPAGFDNDDCFEPHRDVIDDEDQIAIYETVMADNQGDITHVLLYADSYLKDNRLPPRGFTNAQADSIDSQTRPSGTTGDSDFNAANGTEGSGTDTVHYRIDVSGNPNGPYSIDARLLYQAVQPAFIDSMQAGSTRVNTFKTLAQANPPGVEELASESAVSGASAGNTGTGTTTSTDSSGGGGGGCSLKGSSRRPGPDPTLPLLALVAAATLLRLRRRHPKTR